MNRSILLIACIVSQLAWLAGPLHPEHHNYDATPLGVIEVPPNIPATIPEMVVMAANREGIDPQRALNLAWRESRFTDVNRREEGDSVSYGPLQINSRSFPNAAELSVEESIAVGMRHFAGLIRRYGADAEQVYRHGHRRAR